MHWNGPRLAPLSGGKPNSIVVLLHGVAANGRDLLFLAHAWRDLLPDTEFIAPDAPFACDYAPAGRQWFSLQDRTPEKLLAGLRDAAAILDRFFDELLASRGLDDSRLALAGFSQGAATALYAGLHSRRRSPGLPLFPGPCRMDRSAATRDRRPTSQSSSCMARRIRSCPSLDDPYEGHARSLGRTGSGGGKARSWPRHRRCGDCRWPRSFSAMSSPPAKGRAVSAI